MNIASTLHIVLPMLDPAHERNGFWIARTLASTLNASLQVVTAGMKTSVTAADLARQLSVPAEQLADLTIDTATDDLAQATIRIADAREQAMVVLALRIGEETLPVVNAPSFDAIGRQVLEKTTCPVLIVPPEQEMNGWQLHKELLPQDGTPDCASALANVITDSMQRGIESLVLRVAGAKVGQPTEPGSLATPRYVDHPQYEWEAWGQEFLGRITGMGTKINAAGLRLMMASGDPATEILRVAKEEAVDMIILPWHCVFDSGRARMVKAVLHGASCPVLLLPERCNADQEKGAVQGAVH